MKVTTVIYPLAMIAVSAVCAQDFYEDEAELMARDPLFGGRILWNPTFGKPGDGVLGSPEYTAQKNKKGRKNRKDKSSDDSNDSDDDDDADDSDGAGDDAGDDDGDSDGDEDKKSKKKNKKKNKKSKAKKPIVDRREALEQFLYERDLEGLFDDFE